MAQLQGNVLYDIRLEQYNESSYPAVKGSSCEHCAILPGLQSMVHRESLGLTSQEGRAAQQPGQEGRRISISMGRASSGWLIYNDVLLSMWVLTTVTASVPEAVVVHPGQRRSQRVPAQRALRGAQHSLLHR